MYLDGEAGGGIISLLQNLRRHSCHIIARQYAQNMSAVNGPPGGLIFPWGSLFGRCFSGGLKTPECARINESYQVDIIYLKMHVLIFAISVLQTKSWFSWPVSICLRGLVGGGGGAGCVASQHLSKGIGGGGVRGGVLRCYFGENVRPESKMVLFSQWIESTQYCVSK